MKLDETERELEQLRGAAQRIADNLLELEVDSTRELLEASTLTGETAARWSQASASLTELWRQRGLLDSLLQQADKLRRNRREELRSLLDTRSIELSSDDVPLAERRLLDGPQRTLRCSPPELLERMSRSFDDVKTVLAQIGREWDKLLPALDATRRLAAESKRLAEDLGESGRADLESALKELDRLTAAVSSDPLSVRPAEIERLAGSVKAISQELEAITTLKRDFGGQLSRSRERVQALEQVVADGGTAYEEAIVKIAAPSASVRRPPALSDDLGAALADCEALAGRSAWREAWRELERITTRTGALLDDAQAVLAANRAPIEARNQYRALLDAYQVKASALGVVENPRVAAIFEQAREVLYTAPTDLAAAAELVRRYQSALNGPREAAL
jgi:hypothetical protein